MQQILFDCERMKYSNTGLYYYCLNLGVALKKNLHPASMNLSYFKPKNIDDCFGNKVEYIPQNSLQKFLLPPLSKYDLWHCTYQNSDYVPFRNKKIKVILTIHDLNFLYEDKPSEKKAKNLCHLQKNIDRSDAIVCVSDYTKKDVLTHCNIRNKPLIVIHNGVNQLTNPALKNHSYKPQKPFLFSLGVFNRKKNFHVLLPFLSNNKDLELLIAGRPDDSCYINEIKEIASKTGVDNNLKLLYNISEEEKSWYYHNCYAFILPSISEGFGLTVPEAMSVGKPVFLSENTSLPEIGGKNAFYFKNFDSVQMQSDFIHGMQKYEQMDMNEIIKRHSQKFSWDRAAMAYVDVYKSILH